MFTNKKIYIALLLSVFLTNCSLFGDDEDDNEFAGLSTEAQFYERALDQLNGQNFRAAISTYQALESRFPFGRYAEQAQIEIVYAYYRNDDMDAYYMKGLSSFADGGGLFNRFLPIDHTKRDPGRAQESFTDFAQLLALYPDSPYAGDARTRMIYLRNNLAQYEIHVANYYTERRAYIAALRRAQYVVENFQGTPAVSDGIAIMVECYLRLGLNELADTSLALLKENYPEHASIDSEGDFIIRTEITNPSLLYTVTFGLVGDNAVDPPLAPTQRPLTSGSQQIIDSQQDIEVEEENRSFFDIITLGIFN
jgi:outer membrane protein assembly factor BamD